MTEQLKNSLKNTLSTLAIENLTPSREALRLCEQNADGQISIEEAIEKLIRLHGVNHV